MGGIEGQAAFYRGYLIDDQSLATLAEVVLATWSRSAALVDLRRLPRDRFRSRRSAKPPGQWFTLAVWRIAPSTLRPGQRDSRGARSCSR